MKGRANRIPVSREWDEMIGGGDRNKEREKKKKNILECIAAETASKMSIYISSSFFISFARTQTTLPKLLSSSLFQTTAAF